MWLEAFVSSAVPSFVNVLARLESDIFSAHNVRITDVDTSASDGIESASQLIVYFFASSEAREYISDS